MQRVWRLIASLIAVVRVSAWVPRVCRQRKINLHWSKHAAVAWEDAKPAPRLTESTTQSSASNTYDLTSPREWLEYLEVQVGNGAYTVLRCDYNLRERTWETWGQDFHAQRLCESFECLTSDQFNNGAFEQAGIESEEIIACLLESAGRAFDKQHSDVDEDQSCTLMMSLLWQPLESQILVRGHGFSSEVASRALDYNPDPISTTIAVSLDGQRPIPNRYELHPQAKLSSWCRQRRPLENEFKVGDTAEVILTQAINNEIYLLEGLISNLFVIYPGGILRTSDDDSVLGGYARKLVLDCAHKCGLEVDIGPIPMDESHLWEEIFFTSAVRLIIPAREINMVQQSSDGGTELKELWSPPVGTDQTIWRLLYEQMLLDNRVVSS
jgi:hypothetical protein